MKWLLLIAAVAAGWFFGGKWLSEQVDQQNEKNGASPSSGKGERGERGEKKAIQQNEASLCKYGKNGTVKNYSPSETNTAFELCQEGLKGAGKETQKNSFCFPEGKCP